MEPKAKDNKAEKVETKQRVNKLHTELGKLTYEIAKLKVELNKRVQRSNQIGNELEKLDGK